VVTHFVRDDIRQQRADIDVQPRQGARQRLRIGLVGKPAPALPSGLASSPVSPAPWRSAWKSASGIAPTVALDQTANELSPCSPTT
jgi:hypothetical protein